MRKLIIILGLVLFVLVSCGKDLSPQEQLTEDIQKIEDYLSENGLTAESTESGLHYIIDREGSADKPSLNSTVVVRYEGRFLDDEVFDGTGNQTVSFPLRNVIPGWQEGIPLFGRTGSGTLFIPSALGYGSNPPPGIPENAVLIFDVELIDF